jgi:hypothetical protein
MDDQITNITSPIRNPLPPARLGRIAMGAIGTLVALALFVNFWWMTTHSKEKPPVTENPPAEIDPSVQERSAALAKWEAQQALDHMQWIAKRRSWDAVLFNIRENEAKRAYDARQINLAEREALLARIRDEKAAKEDEYQKAN